MDDYVSRVIQGMKDLSFELERRVLEEITEDTRTRCLTAGYVVGMIAENIEQLEKIRPEARQEANDLFAQIERTLSRSRKANGNGDS